MDTPSIDLLAARLDAMERENQWMKRIGGAALIVVTIALTFGTDLVRPARRLVAEGFVLRDPSGRDRAALEIRSDGAPTLALLDHDGRDQVTLRASDEGLSALEYFENSAPRASLTNRPDAGPSLAFHGRSSRSRAEMFLNHLGESGLAFRRDQRGVAMGVSHDGEARVRLTDRLGRDRGGMGLDPEGTLSFLGFYGGETAGLDDDRTTTHPGRFLAPVDDTQVPGSTGNAPAQGHTLGVKELTGFGFPSLLAP